MERTLRFDTSEGFLRQSYSRCVGKEARLIHEGGYVAEVAVDLIYMEEGWSPYLSLEDAKKLDDVWEALRQGDLNGAARYGQVFALTPVAL